MGKRKEGYKKDFREKWIKKFQRVYGRHPTHEEVVIWNYGYDRGYKARKERILDLLNAKNG